MLESRICQRILFHYKMHRAFFFAILFLTIVLVGTCYVTGSYDSSFNSGIVVELHGVLVEVALFSIIFSILRFRVERPVRISENIERIFDYSESRNRCSYSFLKTLKALNADGVDDLQLKDAELHSGRINRVRFNSSTVVHNTYDHIHFDNVQFHHSFFQKSIFKHCRISSSKFIAIDFEESQFVSVTAKKVSFDESYFTKAIFTESLFEDCNFSKARFDGAEFKNVTFRRCIIDRDLFTKQAKTLDVEWE